MTDELYKFIVDKKHHAYRKDITDNFAEEFSKRGLSFSERITERFERLCKMQTPVILCGEQIVFLRTTNKAGDVLTEKEWEEYRKKFGHVHELGYTSNLCGDYITIINEGLIKTKERASEYGKREIDAIINLSERYREEALKTGRDDIAEVLEVVPKYPAKTFRQALQFFRILHFAVWLEGCYHNTVGRFDKYMYPYLKKDLEDGVISESEAQALLDDFFLSFNKDSDLYPGVQQGDNGQSMVLGGIDENGNTCYNLLSKMCLKSSGKLLMIDPKINLRVDKNTPIEVYREGSELTKAGLGFPQYSNDDVVIPALEKLGYSHEDAVNYVVAACWEFIIPKYGYEIVNIGALNFPKVIVESVNNYLKDATSFSDFMEKTDKAIVKEAEKLTELKETAPFLPSPLYDLLIPEKRYRNFGFHGTGVASATDSLFAIKEHIFDKKDVTKERLIDGINTNFENDKELLRILRYESEKMGSDIDEVDELCTRILNDYADGFEGKLNAYGGRYRAGTGTAMYYLWHANDIGATPDGRRAGEPFGTNFSPNLFAKIDGPVSDIRSFTKQNFLRCCNGGPLTLEFASSTFKDKESVNKLADLVRYFILRGGHQLQLNAVNADKMKDAQIHPEKYGQLVVRIWGWSAYFVELDKEYQDHVISRQEYSL